MFVGCASAIATMWIASAVAASVHIAYQLYHKTNPYNYVSECFAQLAIHQIEWLIPLVMPLGQYNFLDSKFCLAQSLC